MNIVDDIAKLKLRMKNLDDRLGAAPLVDLVGVVGTSLPSGGKLYGEHLEHMTFAFHAWRIDGGSVQAGAMTVRRYVTVEELDEFQRLIAPYSVLRIQARVAFDPIFEATQARLEQFVCVETSDVELNDFCAQLRMPVTFYDKVFGILTLDRRVDWYAGQAVWNGKSVGLTVNVGNDNKVAEGLKTAHLLWQDQVGWRSRIDDFAVAELLTLKNGNWLRENESVMTSDEFKQKMKLESISVRSDGSFDFWHNDGDMFWGHAIQISGNLSEGPKYADIPG